MNSPNIWTFLVRFALKLLRLRKSSCHANQSANRKTSHPCWRRHLHIRAIYTPTSATIITMLPTNKYNRSTYSFAELIPGWAPPRPHKFPNFPSNLPEKQIWILRYKFKFLGFVCHLWCCINLFRLNNWPSASGAQLHVAGIKCMRIRLKHRCGTMVQSLKFN